MRLKNNSSVLKVYNSFLGTFSVPSGGEVEVSDSLVSVCPQVFKDLESGILEQLPSSLPSTKLAVNADIVVNDIQIGSVVLKDAVEDLKANVKKDGTDNALVVIQNGQPLPEGAATESTLSEINDKVATETTLNDIKVNTNKLDVNLSSRASEETLSDLSDKVATEATLSDIRTNMSKLDVNLSTRASESTLSSIDSKVATDVELQKKPNVVTDFYIGSVAVPNKDTDVTITLTGTVRRFMFKLRDPARRFRVYKQSGGAYITVPAGSILYEESVLLTNPQFIFQTFDDNQTIEYMYWS